jgi:hypothetical protein
MPRTTWWTGYYGLWLLFFLVPELYWVFVNPVNTLSDQWWALEHLDTSDPWFTQWTPVHWVMFLLVFLLWSWLLLHLPFGLLR